MNEKKNGFTSSLIPLPSSLRGLYAYCLGDEVTDQMVESVAGLSEAKPRVVRCGEIVAVVSEFGDEQVKVTRENVLAHERVVRRVLAETTPLPFRFGTVTSDAKLRSYIDSQRDSLKAQLERVRGCVEMSVKVIWNLEAVRREVAASFEQESKAIEAGGTRKGSGTAFLVMKRSEIFGEHTIKERAAEIADWLNESLKGTVREARVTVEPTAPLVISAAHLVERVRLKEYRDALDVARILRSELHFLTSGAWPPYSFTSVSS
ncbi:MAG TPA: GvpL/GvpF family gas vesicle protein [Pyrinomonadaceae bacterium]|nr:GvpL/GvpF family gas vesicle protein [Pyrinomonadaceae bacterium]